MVKGFGFWFGFGFGFGFGSDLGALEGERPVLGQQREEGGHLGHDAVHHIDYLRAGIEDRWIDGSIGGWIDRPIDRLIDR